MLREPGWVNAWAGALILLERNTHQCLGTMGEGQAMSGFQLGMSTAIFLPKETILRLNKTEQQNAEKVSKSSLWKSVLEQPKLC